MRVRLLYEVIQIGNLIASPRHTLIEHRDGTATGTTVYAWWYRPVVALAFWIAGTSDL